LAIIAYIKREDWDKVGICGICYGKGDKSSSGAYSHSWERETCKCSYGLVEGWQLSHSLVYKDYENKLMNTSVVLELFDKEYKGLYI